MWLLFLVIMKALRGVKGRQILDLYEKRLGSTVEQKHSVTITAGFNTQIKAHTEWRACAHLSAQLWKDGVSLRF